jgi:hypothetical protein
MSENLTRDQTTLLVAISRFPGGTNWYKLGRVVVGQLENPGLWNEDLRVLMDRGLVVELAGSPESPPPLELTEQGHILVQSLLADPKDMS